MTARQRSLITRAIRLIMEGDAEMAITLLRGLLR